MAGPRQIRQPRLSRDGAPDQRFDAIIISDTKLKAGCSGHAHGENHLEPIDADQLQRYFLKRLERLRLTVSVEPAAWRVIEGETACEVANLFGGC